MRIAVNSFRGEAPRVTPRALQANAAQQATNARLLTGDLEAWRQFSLTLALENTGPVQTIYKLSDIWLSWGSDVDVARGAVAGDESFRVFLTGPDEYDEPRWTNYVMAGSGAAPYPFETRPLGVPSPDGAPTVTAGVDPNPTTFNVDVFDEGDIFPSWTVQSPSTDGATPGYTSVCEAAPLFGNPQPSYMQRSANNNFQNGVQCYMHKDFGTTNCTVVRTVFDVYLASDVSSGFGNFTVGVQCTSEGAGVYFGGDNSNGGQIYINLGTGWSSYGTTTLRAVGGLGILRDVWYTCEITNLTNADGTQTITAVLSLGSGEIGRLSATGTFAQGTHVGFVASTTEDSRRYYDNILVQGSGATGYTPINTATSYVYTYVNDIGEESAPSFASATVLRPDGVSITVTTPTTDPDADYVVETKRIYRAVTGATGTFFRFVAEIPLATADYVDTLPDTELGEALESEGWALPPTGLKGLLALPNGVMAGFVGNELCFSAQNHPHAWPVEYRLTVDTDIVAIGNIDTTVVLGTKAFPYLAIGTSPDAYSMTKLEAPQACVAKRSLAYLIGIGVVFASPDGLIAIAGNGNVRNLTSGAFTREQWQALVPESIVATAHDDVYHFFYDTAVEPPPVVSDYLLDTFTGPPGPLTGHTPDAMPAGFVWQAPGEGGAGLSLDGGGFLVNVNENDYNESNTFTPVPVGDVWRVEMDARISRESDSEGPSLTFSVLGGAGLDTWVVALGMESLGNNQCRIYVEAASFVQFSVEMSDGPRAIRLDLTPTSLELFVDDISEGTASVDLSNIVSFSRAVVTNSDVDSLSGAGISRVAVYPEGTPPA